MNDYDRTEVETIGWENARWADGPKVAEWLLARGAVWNDVLYQWREGKRPEAMFEAVDRQCCLAGHHPSELPDDVWILRKAYPGPALDAARDFIAEATLSIRQAAERHGVRPSLLWRRLENSGAV